MTGNIIHLGENYIAGFSETFGAKLHKHPLIEIYTSCDGDSHVMTEQDCTQGQVILIWPNTVHAIEDKGKPGLAIFLDPLTEFGYSLRKQMETEDPIAALEIGSVKPAMKDLAENVKEDKIRDVSAEIIYALQGGLVERPFDDSVLEAIGILNSDDCDYDMNTLAGKVFLSKSRLAHVFSEQTGITLKEYIQYKRLENACRRIVQGTSITVAALDTGFAGSSHIATSSKKLTGMQLRKMLNLCTAL